MSAHTLRSVADAGTLVRFFESCFVRVLEVAGGASDAPGLRDTLLGLLDESAFAAAGQFSAHATITARRFVTAWADERLASDDWPGRDAWRAHPLQSDWGEGRAAGDWLFDAVARLEPTRAEDAALAALALRCLTLGFDGRMHYSPGEVAALRRAIVMRFGFGRPPFPFPPPLAVSAPSERAGLLGGAWRWWLLPLGAACVLAGVYFLTDRSLELYLGV